MGERVLTVRLRAPVASFRRPLDHNYQRTLPLPPPTTILGIAGAALGYNDKELWKEDGIWRRLKVSAWMEAQPGRARDLWTVLKIKNGKIEARSPYIRELLFSVDYFLIYGGDTELLNELSEAFCDPAYPLSLGREDELAALVEVSFQKALPGDKPPVFHGTMIPADIRNLRSFRPILRESAAFEPPLVEKLPVRFGIDEKKGTRQALQMQTITFLPYGIQVEIHDHDIEAWKVRDRTFVWFQFGTEKNA